MFVWEGALRRTVDDDCHAHGQAKASLCAVQVKVHHDNQRQRLSLSGPPIHLIVVFVYDAGDDGCRRLRFPIEKNVLQKIQA